MTRIIASPVEDFPGTVELFDSHPDVTPKMVQDFIDVIADKETENRNERLFLASVKFVKLWSIEGQAAHISTWAEFNPLPYQSSTKLMQFITESVLNICVGTRKVPNE